MANAFASLLDMLKGKKAQTQESDPKSAPSRDVLRINLGIDFGTSYTKVCFRDLTESVSGIVNLDGTGIIPSVVAVDDAGRLWMEHTGAPAKANPYRYLKMQLAGLSGGDCTDNAECRALSAWFLANVIRESQGRLRRDQADRFVGRDDRWSANVGVPVEWYDTKVLGVFEEVLRVAWCWANTERIPTHKNETIEAYTREAASAQNFSKDFHAVPEIAAAVQSFVISREARPDRYLYFDIGGGTVDGVAFNFKKEDGEAKIDFYAGKVEPLGMAYRQDDREFWRMLQCQVSMIIRMAREKEPWRSWRVPRETRNVPSARPVHLTPDNELIPLQIFLGGYGADDEDYRSYIAATYKDFSHANAGIPPYTLRTVPKPNDLLEKEACDFKRFAIAYGLSIQSGTGPEVTLPSELPTYDRTDSVVAVASTNYMDSKDLC